MICPNCNVLCANSETRYEVFGKIKLLLPIIKPTKKKLIAKKIKNSKILLNPIKADYLVSTKRYLGIKNDKSELIIADNLHSKQYLIIPFRITGIFSLYLALKYIKIYFNIDKVHSIFDENYIVNEVQVIPPSLRSVYFDEVTRRMQSPLINSYYAKLLAYNDKYTDIVNTINDDTNIWIGMIHNLFKNKIFDQEIVLSHIIDYDLRTARYQYWIDKIYDDIISQLSGKDGLIRSSILGRTVEFSARSVIRCDPSLNPYEIKVSKNILKKLWNPYFIYYLINEREVDYDMYFEDMISIENGKKSKFDHYFDDFLKWFYEEDQQLLNNNCDGDDFGLLNI